MRIGLFVFLLIFSQISWANQDPYRVLSPQDYEIYLQTFNKCNSGSYSSALRTGFDPAIVKSAATNLSQLMMLSVQASRARWESNMLSPESYRLRHSDGFWWALAHCYSDSSYFRQSLIRNILVMGQLSAEVTGSLASIYFIGQVAKANLLMMETYPIFSRFMLSLGISLKLSTVFNSLKREYFHKPTPEEQKMLQTIEANLFDRTDETLRQVIQLSQMKVESMDQQLRDPNLDSQTRNELLKKREGLVKKIQELSQSIQKSQNQ